MYKTRNSFILFLYIYLWCTFRKGIVLCLCYCLRVTNQQTLQTPNSLQTALFFFVSRYFFFLPIIAAHIYILKRYKELTNSRSRQTHKYKKKKNFCSFRMRETRNNDVLHFTRTYTYVYIVK